MINCVPTLELLSMTKAPIALTCGDPAGIGPELALKAWRVLKDDLAFFWIGDFRHVPATEPKIKISDPLEALSAMREGLPILHHAFKAPAVAGAPTLENAVNIIEVIERGVNLVIKKKATALTTAPISKRHLIDGAAFGFTGHTDFLSHLSGIDHAVMMLAAPELKVVPVTQHIALSKVAESLTPELVRETIRITAASLKQYFGLSNPHLAVTGLNPHSGEGGRIGTEETDWMINLLNQLRRSDHLNVSGPHPADTMFHPKARLTYDAAILMYHDQALIPIKTLFFDEAVNVTLGLPFIRTSPDHGTAFDIAGKDIASPRSMIEALKLAHQIADRL